MGRGRRGKEDGEGGRGATLSWTLPAGRMVEQRNNRKRRETVENG